MKKLLLAASALTLLSVAAQAAPVNVSAWTTTAQVAGDKTYTYITSTGTAWQNTTQVEATIVTGSPVKYSLNNSGLNSVTANFSYSFSIAIDPVIGAGLVFGVSRLSVNDVLGNVNAGATARVYSDALFTNQLNTSSVTGSGSAAAQTYSTNFTTLYVQIDGTNISPGNLLANITFDVTQRAASVPEPASMALLGAGLLGLGFARRRRG